MNYHTLKRSWLHGCSASQNNPRWISQGEPPPTFRRYWNILFDKVLVSKHILRSMDVSVLFISTFTNICSVVQGQFVHLVAIWTPLRCGNEFVQYDNIIQLHQLGLYHSHARMLNNRGHAFLLVPLWKLFVLHHYGIVLLQHMNYLVCLVFLLVRQLEVLTLNLLDCLVSRLKISHLSCHIIIVNKIHDILWVHSKEHLFVHD